MDTVREWAAAICVVAVLCSAAGMVTPDGKISKGMRLITGLIVLSLFISPLSQISNCSVSKTDLASNENETTLRLLSLVEEQTSEAMSHSVSELISAELGKLEIDAKEISVVMDISGDGCISIGQVVVEIGSGDEHMRDQIHRTIREKLGLEAKIVTTEE